MKTKSGEKHSIGKKDSLIPTNLRSNPVKDKVVPYLGHSCLGLGTIIKKLLWIPQDELDTLNFKPDFQHNEFHQSLRQRGSYQDIDMYSFKSFHTLEF